MIPQHSSATNEHYTPKDVIAAARETMGGIDLDPASCAQANRLVGATHYFAQGQNGLLPPWAGRVFLNPPGGREFPPDEKHRLGSGRPNSQLWWPKLAEEYMSGRVTQAIFIGFSIEILQTSQNLPGFIPLDFPFCVPKGRLAFLDEQLVPQTQPTHANVIVYLPPPKVGTAEGLARFAKAFRGIGRVVIPRVKA